MGHQVPVTSRCRCPRTPGQRLWFRGSSDFKAGWCRTVTWWLRRLDSDLNVRSFPSYRIEFGPEPDDFRCQGYGSLGELSEHLTNLRIDRDNSAHLIIGHLAPDIPATRGR